LFEWSFSNDMCMRHQHLKFCTSQAQRSHFNFQLVVLFQDVTIHLNTLTFVVTKLAFWLLSLCNLKLLQSSYALRALKRTSADGDWKVSLVRLSLPNTRGGGGGRRRSTCCRSPRCRAMFTQLTVTFPDLLSVLRSEPGKFLRWSLWSLALFVLLPLLAGLAVVHESNNSASRPSSPKVESQSWVDLSSPHASSFSLTTQGSVHILVIGFVVLLWGLDPFPFTLDNALCDCIWLWFCFCSWCVLSIKRRMHNGYTLDWNYVGAYRLQRPCDHFSNAGS
jgi:hypothetical protein